MDIALIAVLTLVASLVGTITGFGTSTIMVPVLVALIETGANPRGSPTGRVASRRAVTSPQRQ